MLPTLRECTEQVALVESMLLETGGELTPEIEQMLVVKEIQLPQKVDAYGYRIQMLESKAEWLKEKVSEVEKVISSYETAIAKTKEGMKIAMKELGVEEIEGNEIRFKTSSTAGKLVIENEELIPKDYKKEVVKIEIDKDRLKEDLKIGKVEGCKLEIGTSLRMSKAKGGKR